MESFEDSRAASRIKEARSMALEALQSAGIEVEPHEGRGIRDVNYGVQLRFLEKREGDRWRCRWSGKLYYQISHARGILPTSNYPEPKAGFDYAKLVERFKAAIEVVKPSMDAFFKMDRLSKEVCEILGVKLSFTKRAQFENIELAFKEKGASLSVPVEIEGSDARAIADLVFALNWAVDRWKEGQSNG
ncbi:MAG: hypothetical protein JW704_08410 [Anaerolineaceae bacterium]|nr:hypothetical protein [Anaerolineaceae bacterium]